MISRSTAEVAFASLTGLFGGVIVYGATEFGVGWSASGPEPGTFPFYIGLIVVLASLANLVIGLRHRKSEAEPFVTAAHLVQIARFVLPMLGFVVLSLLLGLYVATALYMFAVMAWQNHYPVWHAALVSIGLPLALFVLLEKGFKVSLFKGPLEAALGL